MRVIEAEKDEAMTDEILARAASVIQSADKELRRMIDERWHGSGYGFRMRIPVQQDDSDVIIGNLINESKLLLGEVERLQFDLAMERNSRAEWMLSSEESLSILREAGWKSPSNF